MRHVRPCFVIVAILSFGTIAAGNNTYFLPGDAFFFARIDAKTAKKLLNVDSPTLSYGSHWSGGFGCGYIGYKTIRIMNMPAKTREALLDACKSFAEKLSKNPSLEGKISVFIYSHDYDWKKRGLALQYNEKWVDESVAFGAGRDHVRLESFVRKPSSIIQNWRDSVLIAPLTAKCPTLPEYHKQAWTKSPVEIESKKCRILVIPNRTFDEYVQPSQNGLELIEIVDGKLVHYVRENGKWKPKS